jgi:hypothetical protein
VNGFFILFFKLKKKGVEERDWGKEKLNKSVHICLLSGISSVVCSP